MTPYDILIECADAIDKKFGRDYAKRNPDVLNALIKTWGLLEQEKLRSTNKRTCTATRVK